MDNEKRLLDAAAFAARNHSGQKRKGKDGEPYINHPLEVANLLISVGAVDDINILTAALLHDTVEDTATTQSELVMEVTDDKLLPKHQRKRLQVEHAPHLSPGAKLVKLADKISNITDILERPPSDWDDQRRREYVEWGISVVAGLRGINPALEEHFDQIAKRAEMEICGLAEE